MGHCGQGLSSDMNTKRRGSLRIILEAAFKIFLVFIVSSCELW